MSYKDQDIINEINFTQRCILMSVISQDKNIVLVNSFQKIPIVRLYTADSTFQNFIYSKIKGAFCLFISKEKDPKNRKYFLRIYDLKDYSLSFNMEIKKEHMQYITQYKDDFYFMELRQSFLGFQFLSKESGRVFFLLLNEDPKKEVIDQNEGSINIKPKEISKTTNKVIDYIKMRLKYKFENANDIANVANNSRKSAKKKEMFPIMVINDKKGEYLETSNIPEIGLLINNIEIDEADSNIYLFTENKLNYDKCQKIIKKYDNILESSIYRRNSPNVPINIIDKDCVNILNKNIYIGIMVKNMVNNISMQKRLDIFQQEHKKRHKGNLPAGSRRKTKGRLSKIGRKDSRISNISKNERNTMSEYYSEDKNRRNTYNKHPSLNFNNNNDNSKNTTNNISTNIKLNAKSVDKENKGRFTDKKKMQSEMLKGMEDEQEIDLEKGGLNYFNNENNNLNKNKQNNINLKKGVDIIEERPEDEEKDRERKYKKREIILPNKYNNKNANIKTNNYVNNNVTNNANNTKVTNNIASRANIYKRPIAGNTGKGSNVLSGRGKK